MRRFLWFVILLLYANELLAGRDSLLWANIRDVGLVYQRGQSDSAKVRALMLLPVAKEQANTVAQAMLHVIIGMAHGEKDNKQAAIDEFNQCIELAEANDFLFKTTQPKYRFLFQTMIPAYAQQALFCDELGLQQQSLESAKNALRWMEHSKDERICAISMPGVSQVLVKHGEYKLAYVPTKNSLKWCAAHGQQEMAKGLLASLVVIETALNMKEDAGTAVLTTDKGQGGIPSSATSPPSDQPKDTHKAITPPPSSNTQHPSSNTYIEYIKTHNVLIIIICVLLVLMVFLFLSYILWQRRLRRKRSAEAIQQMEERFIEGQESERARLARELHDNVSNQLLAIEMRLSSDGLTPQTMQLLNESREQVRRVSHELLPPEFEHATLCEVACSYADEQDGLNGCKVNFMSSPDNTDWTAIPPKIALEVYRIMQEAVGNAQKHAHATLISIGLHMENGLRLMLTVSDDGVENTGIQTKTGIGLRTMGQRADAIGGHLSFFKYQFGNTMKLTVELKKSL